MDTLTSGKEAVAHRAMDGLRSGGCGRRQTIQLGIHETLLLNKIIAQVHASRLARVERLGSYLAVFADEHLNARFGFFELLAAGFAQLHAALEELDRTLEGEVTAVQF